MASATSIADFEAVSPTRVQVAAYAQLGWRVLPVYEVRSGSCSCDKTQCKSPGKHPRLLNGAKGATTDQSVIRAWSEQWPAANFAIATGDGLVVLDVDPDKGGDESLALLLGGSEPAWHTPTVLTGSGGRHFYFRTDQRIGNRVAFRGLAGLDVRGDGGYVVAPPSNHLRGKYEWHSGYGPDTGLIEWPFSESSEAAAAVHNHAEGGTSSVIAAGRRNDTLLRFAGAMRRAGMSGDAIAIALLTENEARCTPALSVDEVMGIAHGIERYPANSSTRTVEARLGVLAQLPWVALPHVALSHRQLGLTPAEFGALSAVLARHWAAGTWGSFSQQDLAASIGVDRRTISDQLQSLRRKGFVAVRPDMRHGRTVAYPHRSPTLYYCAEPYLAALSLQAARTNPLRVLRESGNERLGAFVSSVQNGDWTWEVGDLISTSDSPKEMARIFLVRIGLDAESVGTRRESNTYQPDSTALLDSLGGEVADDGSRRRSTARGASVAGFPVLRTRRRAVLPEVHAAGQT